MGENENIITTEIETTFTKNVSKILQQNKNTKADLARKLNWAPSKLTKMLNMGNENWSSVAKYITLSDASAIATALGMSIEELIKNYTDDYQFQDICLSDKRLNLQQCFESIFENTEKRFVFVILKSEIIRALSRKLENLDYKYYIASELNSVTMYDSSKSCTFEKYYPEIAIEMKTRPLSDGGSLAIRYWISSDFSSYAIGIIYENGNLDEVELKRRVALYSSYLYRTFNRRSEKLAPFSCSENFSESFDSNIYYIARPWMDENQNTVSDIEEQFDDILSLYNSLLESPLDIDIETKTIDRKEDLPDSYLSSILGPLGAKCSCCGDGSFLSNDMEPFFYYKHFSNTAENSEAYNSTANILALCPKCKDRLKYGLDVEREQMIIELYQNRRAALKEKGMNISLASILHEYGL